MLQELEKELECSLCKDTFREPKTLRCLHSFCLECLQIYAEKNHSNICLSCPICRTPFQSNSSSNSKSKSNTNTKSSSNSKLKPGEFFANLSTDSFLLNNLNIYNSLKNSIPQQQQQEQKPQRPQRRKKKQKIVCIDGENEATSYCLDCQDYFCQTCTKGHQKAKLSKNHQIIPINEMKDEDHFNSITNSDSNNQLNCQIHQQKELELFCDDCKFSICTLCVDQHTSHKIFTLSNIIGIEKQSLMDLINQVCFFSFLFLSLFSENNLVKSFFFKVKPKEKELKEGLKKCEEIIIELEINSTATQTQINELFNKIRTKLNEREQELLNKLDEIEKQKKKELQLQKEELQFGIESIIGSCQMIEHSLSLSNNSKNNNKNFGRLLSMKKLYESRLDYLIKNDWKIKPKCDSSIEFSNYEEDEQSISSTISDIGILGSSEISIEKCLISRNEDLQIFKDKEFKLEIISYSKEGYKMRKGGNGKKFNIQIERELSNESNEKNKESEESEWEIRDLNNGKYEVKLKIKNEGKYLISLQCNGFDLNISPVQIQVLSKLKQRNYHEINKPKLTIGGLSSYGITIDSNGNICVCNLRENRIEVFNSGGKFILKFGSFGNGNGQFNYPWGIAINSKGNIIVSDRDNHRIQIFDSKGKFISKFGSFGNGNGQFNKPKGICVDLNDNIYVCDSDNHRIQIFDAEGRFISKFGSQGKENDQFDGPVAITINSHGNIIISDLGHHRIQIFDSKRKFILTFGSEGEENGQFNYPYGICTDSDNNILVCDYFNLRIQIFDSNGKYMTKLGIMKPSSIAFDFKTQNIIICEGYYKLLIF